MAAVILIFIFPLRYMSYRDMLSEENVIQTAVNSFTGAVLTDGKITQKMYDGLMRKIAETECVCKVEMMVGTYLYTDIENGMAESSQNNGFDDELSCTTNVVYNSDILNVLDLYGEYQLYEGDLFSVVVTLLTDSPSQRISDMFFDIGHKKTDFSGGGVISR